MLFYMAYVPMSSAIMIEESPGSRSNNILHGRCSWSKIVSSQQPTKNSDPNLCFLYPWKTKSRGACVVRSISSKSHNLAALLMPGFNVEIPSQSSGRGSWLSILEVWTSSLSWVFALTRIWLFTLPRVIPKTLFMCILIATAFIRFATPRILVVYFALSVTRPVTLLPHAAQYEFLFAPVPGGMYPFLLPVFFPALPESRYCMISRASCCSGFRHSLVHSSCLFLCFISRFAGLPRRRSV